MEIELTIKFNTDYLDEIMAWWDSGMKGERPSEAYGRTLSIVLAHYQCSDYVAERAIEEASSE